MVGIIMTCILFQMKLIEEEVAIFVCATTGQGDEPDNMKVVTAILFILWQNVHWLILSYFYLRVLIDFSLTFSPIVSDSLVSRILMEQNCFYKAWKKNHCYKYIFFNSEQPSLDLVAALQSKKSLVLTDWALFHNNFKNIK